VALAILKLLSPWEALNATDSDEDIRNASQPE